MPTRDGPASTRLALSQRTLDSPNVRYLLAIDLPDMPPEIAQDADTYLVSIAVAALLDGDEGRHGSA
jgi:hypothetical protein